MQRKSFQATHPDMIVGLDTAEKLRRHYLLTELFAARRGPLNYSHVERLICRRRHAGAHIVC